MPFVKLDCKILDSTLWMDIEAREMFITALLMASPWETESDLPQLDVKTMKPTGWKVPAGWYGFVPAAGPGIVRRAGLDMKGGMAALERLGAPEPESRSPNYEGRRLARVHGGFVVLNYMHYRDKDHGAAERMRNYRVLVKTGLAPIIKAQGGRCDCCGEQFEKPYVKYVVQDHDDKTHKNRGLVCQSCNTVIGRIERGSSTYSEKREACLKYIERYTVTANVTPVHPNVTQAEAEAEAEVEEGGLRPPYPPPPKRIEKRKEKAFFQSSKVPRNRTLPAAPPEGAPELKKNPFFEVEGLNKEAFAEWDAVRRERGGKSKTAWTAKAQEKTVKLLAQYTHIEQQAMVDASIAAGYQGLFPPGKGNGAKSFKQIDADEEEARMKPIREAFVRRCTTKPAIEGEIERDG